MIDPKLPSEIAPALVTKEERVWGMSAHLSALILGHFLPTIGQIVGPLIIWLAKRDSSAFVADQAKESLNAQISATIYGLIAGALVFLLIGIPLLFALWVADIILVIVASIAAYDGKAYRYPLILRLVK